MSFAAYKQPEVIVIDDSDSDEVVFINQTTIRFIPYPTVVNGVVTAWDGLSVQPVPKKGMGVIATRDIALGLLIPYIGKHVDPGPSASDYLSELPVLGDTQVAVDASPVPGEGQLSIAGRINEIASLSREQYNCRFVFIRKGRAPQGGPQMPIYPHLIIGTDRWATFIMTVQPIAAGQELLVCYGKGYHDTSNNEPARDYKQKYPTAKWFDQTDIVCAEARMVLGDIFAQDEDVAKAWLLKDRRFRRTGGRSTPCLSE
jgi:hypothetical protein